MQALRPAMKSSSVSCCGGSVVDDGTPAVAFYLVEIAVTAVQERSGVALGSGLNEVTLTVSSILPVFALTFTVTIMNSSPNLARVGVEQLAVMPSNEHGR